MERHYTILLVIVLLLLMLTVGVAYYGALEKDKEGFRPYRYWYGPHYGPRAWPAGRPYWLNYPYAPYYRYHGVPYWW